MYSFKINNITVNTIEGEKSIIPKNINILVGPNNSGKSRFLKELRNYLSGDNRDIKIISKVEFPFPENLEEIDATYDVTSKMVQDQYGNWMLKAYSNKPNQVLDMSMSLENYFTRNLNSVGGNWREYFSGIIDNDNKDAMEFLRWFGSLFYQYMGTEERLTICKTQKDYGLDSSSTNYLSSFKYQDKLLKDLSARIIQLFGIDVFLDTQTLGDRLVFRTGNDFGYIKNKTNYSEDLAYRLFSEKTLDDQGDGLKSFVSTFLSLNYMHNDILLIDEPEAFLHPPLARQLGEMIGDSGEGDKTIFVATHSVEILKGILSRNQNVNVIRITREKDCENNIMLLDQEVLNSIITNPLLRVSRVLEGIFCEKVIITEAEADELIYQELCEKMFPESGLFFAHGQNKQTLVPIANMYQKIGVEYEIVTDFDVLRVSSEFHDFLKLMTMNERERQKLKDYADKLREQINNSVDVSGMKEDEIEKARKEKRNIVYHEQGIRFFDKDLRCKIQETLLILSKQHLHILETGELETLLEEYDIPYKEKKLWIVDAINKVAELKRRDIKCESMLYQFIHRIAEND